MQRASSSKMVGNTEFDILKASHKFLREDDEQNLTWEDQVAKKYYDSLFREFAVCNLKHYKTGQFALRWRSESEVLSGAGEETCGNTRCSYHEPSRSLNVPPLKTVELPFAYEEEGSVKSALVKVVLCDKCLKKLMYKREKERERAEGRRGEGSKEEDADAEKETEQGDELDSSADVPEERRDRKDRRDRNSRHKEHRRDRNSRSRSPRRRESNSQAT